MKYYWSISYIPFPTLSLALPVTNRASNGPDIRFPTGYSLAYPGLNLGYYGPISYIPFPTLSLALPVKIGFRLEMDRISGFRPIICPDIRD